jgi:hypothetical protein
MGMQMKLKPFWGNFPATFLDNGEIPGGGFNGSKVTLYALLENASALKKMKG